MSDEKRTRDLNEARPQRRWQATVLVVGLTAAVLVLLALGGDAIQIALRYDRDAVLAEGEYWRLLTAHLVHGGREHAFVNLVGLIAISIAFPRVYSAREWLAIAAICTLAIDAGLILIETDVAWYVGLSGVLHGLVVAAAIGWWRQGKRAVAVAVLAVVCGKLGWEQWRGSLEIVGSIPVLVESHLYGAIGGLAAALPLILRGRWPQIVRSL